jgi:hypothetical protein
MAAPSEIRLSASPRWRQPHTNGTLNDHLSLVDEVDLERFEHLSLGKMPDATLGHHRDRHRLFDPLDHVRVGHAGHAAVGADIGRHPLQRHHRHGSRLFGDLGLVGGDDIHDHASLEHFRQAALYAMLFI